jgi:aspartyl-tRNA(Asn)/glutamyl-tRNA(Gln) amidotransferase subunit C
MAEPITRAQVEATARLARILLGKEEIDGFTTQLGSILAHMETLGELDTAEVEPLAHVLPLKNVLRPDAARPSIGADLALREAPDKAGGFFRVPKVLGEGSGA